MARDNYRVCLEVKVQVDVEAASEQIAVMDAIYAIERGRVAPDWQVTRIDILD